MRRAEPLSFISSHPSHPLTDRNQLLQVALDAVLEFSPDRRPLDPGEAPSKEMPYHYGKWLIEKLLFDLQSHFLRDLYVHRSILGKILEKSAKGRLTLVAGLPGVGKTIVMLKIRELLLHNRHPDDGVVLRSEPYAPIYVDLKKHSAGFIAFEEASEMNASKTIQLLAYCLCEELTYVTTAEVKKQLELDLVHFLRDPHIAEHMALICSQVIAENFERPYIIFDSVDNLSLWQQGVALDYVQSLSTSVGCACVMPIRTANIQRYRRSAYKTDLTDFIEFDVEPEDEKTHDESNSLDLTIVDAGLNSMFYEVGQNGSHTVSKEKSSAVLRDILSKRLQKVKEYKLLTDFLVSLGGSGGRISKEDYLAYFERLSEFILNELVRGSGMYEAVNRSIRESLIVTNGITAWALSGQQPEFTLEKNAWSSQAVRSMFYRFLTTSSNIHRAKEVGHHHWLKGPNLWQQVIEDSSSMERKPLNALPFRLFEYLTWSRSNDTRGCTRAALYNHFQMFNVGRDQVDAALMTLLRPTPDSAGGLVWLRQSGQEEEEVCLLPAGRFFFRRLGMSLEYLFWSWATTPMFPDSFKDWIKDTSYAKFTSDQTRVDVGLRILRSRFFGIFEDEYRAYVSSLGARDQTRLAFIDVHVSSGHIMKRLVDGFVSHVRALGEEFDSELQQAMEIKDKVDAVFVGI